jgi:hypothetical protein
VGQHGIALSSVSRGSPALRGEDHAHVGPRDREVEHVFLRLRWPTTEGKPVCPGCGCMICYVCRRSANQWRWRCKACRRDFSITSGTLFAWHKLPLRSYLQAFAAVCNEVVNRHGVWGSGADRRPK